MLGPAAAGVRFHHTSYGYVWLRDTGPIFVVRDGELSAVRFGFDGWGGKYVMPGDTEVAARVTAWDGVRGAAYDLVLEGPRLHHEFRRAWFAGIPLPRWLAPWTIGWAEAGEGGWRVMVRIFVPVVGELVRYEGWIEPE